MQISGPDRLAAEYDIAGTLRRRYGWGPGVDEPVVQDEGGAMNCSGTRFLHSDHQGSIVAAANCSGTRLSVNSYDEYGVPGAGNWGRFQYTGQVWLPELGMYYYKARIYAPQLGRFMQTDPIGYDDQINLYAYVGNDPVNGFDPSGMCTESLIANDDGTCALTGGLTTGNDGLLQADALSDLGGTYKTGPGWLFPDPNSSSVGSYGAAQPQSGNLILASDSKVPGVLTTCPTSGTCILPISPAAQTVILDKHYFTTDPNKSRLGSWALNLTTLNVWSGAVVRDGTRTFNPASGNYVYTSNVPFVTGFDARRGFHTDELSVVVRPVNRQTGTIVSVYPGR